FPEAAQGESLGPVAPPMPHGKGNGPTYRWVPDQHLAEKNETRPYASREQQCTARGTARWEHPTSIEQNEVAPIPASICEVPLGCVNQYLLGGQHHKTSLT